MGNKVKIVNENVDKITQNTHVLVNILARQTSKAGSRVWIVQNVHIAETVGEVTNQSQLNSTEILQLMKRHTSCY